MTRSSKYFLMLIILQISDGDDDDDFEVVPQQPDDDVNMWNAEDENEDEVKKAKIQSKSLVYLSCKVYSYLVTELGLITPEAVTIAQQLVNRQTTKTQLINDGFNRYSLNSKEGLPSWFLDDESKFYKPNLPITKEAVIALREKQRALDARPIKKVAEAKARKKFKAHQRLEKALKKAEGVNATADMSEREKAQQIEKVMRKGMSSGQKAKKDIKVVVAKGAHKGIQGRPKGVKGRYQMVDSRMKKEVRHGSYTYSSKFNTSFSFVPKNGQKRQTRNARRVERAINCMYYWLLCLFTSYPMLYRQDLYLSL